MKWFRLASGGKLPKACPLCGVALTSAFTPWTADWTVYSPCGCREEA